MSHLHKREVCRFWINNTCVKGSNCEFLHEFKHESMPMCRKGGSCVDPSCPFKHDQTDRPRCPNYDAGFCSFGSGCQYQHIKQEIAPEIAQQFFDDDPLLTYLKNRKKEQPTFRSRPCEYYKADGWCPYFSICAFKHE